MKGLVKAIGAVLIIASGIGIGLGGAAELRRRVRILTDLIASLMTVKAEITVRMTPLPELLEGLGRLAPLSVRGFYGRVAQSVQFLGECSFAELWLHAIEKSEELGLKVDELRELIALGTSLGRYGVAEQAAAIDLCISRLNAMLELAREEALTSGKLFIGLSAAGGIVAAVILI